jgi:hypothetical protein
MPADIAPSPITAMASPMPRSGGPELARHGEAERGRDRGGGMGGAEGVVGAFGPLGEARQAVLHAQRPDAVAAAGEDLVRVALVRDVPDDPVAGRVEDGVQRDGEFDHAEPRAEVAARDGDGGDGFGAQFVGDLAEVGVGELP